MTVLVESLPPFEFTAPAQARAQAVQTLVDFANTFREQISYRVAVAGDGAGALDVPGANRRIYVRLGDANGPIAEAQTDAFVPALDEAVLLERIKPFGLGGWLVKGWLAGGSAPCLPIGDVA